MAADARAPLETAIEAVRGSCSAIDEVTRAGTEPGLVQKGLAGPATVADLASQVAAWLVLRRTDIPVMAEESLEEVERHGGSALIVLVANAVRAAGFVCDEGIVREALCASADRRSDRGERWVLDPLDGTKGYLRGGQFAVALALVRDGRPVLGVLGAPRLARGGSALGAGMAFAAAVGGGAWQSPLRTWEPELIRARPWGRGDAIRVAGSVEAAHSSSDSLEEALRALGPVESVRVDSQAKYALVSRGDADVYCRMSPKAGYRECAWDHAAGCVIAEECGCAVSDLSGNPLDFSTGARLDRNCGVLCAPRDLWRPALLALSGIGG
jgi:3'(2'), 5'-bisphosphate nucleotidase